MPSENGPEIIMLPKFKRDFKRLKRKYRSLSDDMVAFQKALLLAHSNRDVGLESIDSNPVQGVPGGAENVFIAKKFACRALKGRGARTGIRIVYQIDMQCVKLMYIELFHKKEKPLPDMQRIERILRNEQGL